MKKCNKFNKLFEGANYLKDIDDLSKHGGDGTEDLIKVQNDLNQKIIDYDSVMVEMRDDISKLMVFKKKKYIGCSPNLTKQHLNTQKHQNNEEEIAD